MLASMARPGKCAGLVPEGFVQAVIALDGTSTAWWLADQIATQLALGVPSGTSRQSRRAVITTRRRGIN